MACRQSMSLRRGTVRADSFIKSPTETGAELVNAGPSTTNACCSNPCILIIPGMTRMRQARLGEPEHVRFGDRVGALVPPVVATIGYQTHSLLEPP